MLKKVKIKSIKKLDKKIDRYDLQVKDIHNFFANGVLIHNTSQRYSLALEEILPKWKQIWNKFFWRFKILKGDKKYSYVNGTRRTILLGEEDTGFYKGSTFRNKVVEGISLKKNEILFFEVAGWTDTGASIMARQPIKDKELKKLYGDEMIYKYGQPEGTCGMYVYRIVTVNEDGNLFEYSWQQVKQRCKELGLKSVPEFTFTRPVLDKDNNEVSKLETSAIIYDGRQDWLLDLCEKLSNGPSTLDSSHLREGVCVRVEHETGFNIYKYKSYTFLNMEQELKDDETSIDLEEAL